jgi:uncharacterized protein
LRFIADGMLGKLSRWMRLLGEDVLYVKDTDDELLIRLTKEEKRILLTSDQELYRRVRMKEMEAYLVEERTEAKRLAEVARNFGIPLEVDPDRSRCSTCNNQIIPARKEEVEAKVPKGVLERNEIFWVCSRCGKVYWKGGHWLNIYKVLKEANQVLDDSKRHKPLARS